MKTTLSEESINEISRGLKPAFTEFAARYPGESGSRQPVHTVYGGAHLFKSDTAPRLGSLALRAFETYAPDAATFAGVLELPEKLSGTIYERVSEKLRTEPVEDFRIDFEDGYGARPDAEEDGHAVSAARETAAGFSAGTLPLFIGIRVKPFSEELHVRSLRTLDLFLTALTEQIGGRLPENFVITLPKIYSPAQVAALTDVFDLLEPRLNLPHGSLKMEMMIETTQSIINERGEANLPKLLAAARDRCTAAHFGTYDYTASCSITAAYQDMLHPACDFARNMMQVAFGGTGVWLSDGATNIMPVAPHRGELSADQQAENRQVVHRAWKLHYEHIRHSLANAFYQGWDLHPAQLPTRYAAVFTFFLEGLDAASERLRNFVAKAAQATLVGDVFDDAATGQGLLNYFIRAINCRAVTEQEAQDLTGLTIEELRSASFVKILRNRQQ
ncbi:MAG: phosphoenolpyruvate kinase [Acidobacteriota bacterium]|nr:phosphoenolpyruvate kinase [Acidobacteriota bacterium]